MAKKLIEGMQMEWEPGEWRESIATTAQDG